MLCDSYCSHGGRCERARGHGGLHDSSFCQWTDADALTREQADMVLMVTEGGRQYLATFGPLADMLEAMIGEDEE
jgi:hypothetical protein